MQENEKTEFPRIKKFLERIYKSKLEDIFLSVDPEPLGIASLAQVHKAYLKDGTPVAVKVQHDYISKQFKGDIIMVKLGCALAEIIFPDFKYKVKEP